MNGKSHTCKLGKNYGIHIKEMLNYTYFDSYYVTNTSFS